jgi:hypothetical protein
VKANVEHLGPFRPTLWVHWELAANTFDANPVAWRLARWMFCWASAGLLLWLMKELGLPAPAALLAGAVAMWNPYRSEIWTSLTLAEGIAMPYALFSLIAARRAAVATRKWPWEAAAMAAVLVALGCKNTFAALVPVQLYLRISQDGVPFRTALRAHGLRAAVLVLPLALPIAHFIYFKLNWRPGNYTPHSPTWGQGFRMLNAYKGALGLDFVGVGLAACALVSPRMLLAHLSHTHTRPLTAGALLAAGGFVVYLPLDMVAPRYSMPGVWGLDLAVAALLASYGPLPTNTKKLVAGFTLVVGIAVLAGVTLGRQDKVKARATMLWNLVHDVETTAPPGTAIAWVGGDSTKGALNEEEGIHFAWHLRYRHKADVVVGLISDSGAPITRVELPTLTKDPLYRISGFPTADAWWIPEREFSQSYWFGRKHYSAHLARSVPVAPKAFVPMDILKNGFTRDSGGK